MCDCRYSGLPSLLLDPQCSAAPSLLSSPATHTRTRKSSHHTHQTETNDTHIKTPRPERTPSNSFIRSFSPTRAHSLALARRSAPSPTEKGQIGSDPLKMYEQSLKAEPNPIPAPKAIADHRVVGLRNNVSAAAAPPAEEYTTLLNVKSIAASHF